MIFKFVPIQAAGPEFKTNIFRNPDEVRSAGRVAPKAGPNIMNRTVDIVCLSALDIPFEML